MANMTGRMEEARLDVLIFVSCQPRSAVLTLFVARSARRGAPPSDCLPLAFGHDPVRDANVLAGESVRPASNVAGWLRLLTFPLRTIRPNRAYGRSRDLPVPAQGASVHARVSDHAGSDRRSQ